MKILFDGYLLFSRNIYIYIYFSLIFYYQFTDRRTSLLHLTDFFQLRFPRISSATLNRDDPPFPVRLQQSWNGKRAEPNNDTA